MNCPLEISRLNLPSHTSCLSHCSTRSFPSPRIYGSYFTISQISFSDIRIAAINTDRQSNSWNTAGLAFITRISSIVPTIIIFSLACPSLYSKNTNSPI
jgi:hypothetical protein